MQNKKPQLSVLCVALSAAFAAVSAGVQADTGAAPAIPVIGILPDRLEAVPGAFDVIKKKELDARRPFSVKEALNQVPGINIVDEDAAGNALNIGVRGLDPRRSSRVLLLEDGMPLFLAPYGDPAAHYSTPLERVERIEVVKGSGQILYGPQTIGGMINFITRPVPRDGFRGTIQGSVGNRDYHSGYLNVGYGTDRGGFMIEGLQKQGDGVRRGHDFDIEDVMLKGRLQLTESHELLAKAHIFREESHITETGLGLAEYRQDKFQAPTARQDRFNQDRNAFQLVHNWRINESAKLSTQMYYVDTFRASFRQINDPGGLDGFSAIERCPSALGGNGNRLASLGGEGCGGRWRPRDFNYYGIEPRLDIDHNLFGIQSSAVFGVRFHAEEQTRQAFRASDPAIQSLSFARANVDPREDIRIDTYATSLYGQNTFFLGDFAVTPGVRVEKVRSTTVVNAADGASLDEILAAIPEFKNRVKNDQTLVLPGLGVAWNGIPRTTIFTGVHDGFGPPRPSRDIKIEDPDEPGGVARINAVKPERSRNWELGFRSGYFNGVNVASTLFLTKFDDIVAEADAGQFRNFGKSEQAGIELAGRIDFGTIFNSVHNVYLTGSYINLFTAKFTKDFATADEDSADVSSGERLPYAPRHMASLNLGYQHPVGVDGRIGVDYRSEQLPDPFGRGQDAITGLSGSIPSFALLNASINYRAPGSKVTYFVSGHNLTDREYLASRRDGMVAGRPRTVFGGVRFDF